jgi:leucyl/phenylalanyl-tRNA--protein transferase
MSDRSPADAQSIDAILEAYRRGYFPMAEPRPPWNPFGGSHIFWPSPDPRGILPLTPAEGLHVPRRLERTIRSGRFEIRCDTAFADVMAGCAGPRRMSELDPDSEGTWIDSTITRWFTMLHKAGHAHSIEAWRTDHTTGEERLVGGLYGLTIGSAFFGESMFHSPQPRLLTGERDPFDGTDAGNVCLITLTRHLARLGFALFDTQMVTTHVSRFGAVEIPRVQYLQRLFRAVEGEGKWERL